MSGPLTGYRVIDFTNVIAGPLATMILADQGADVIKVEAPQRPDHTRHVGPGSTGMTAAFVNNKRSISIDLKSDDGRAALKRLVSTADVFIQNFRPGVVERLGVGEADLRAVKADLIYVSMGGWGESGPLSHKPVYDPIIQALSGLATVQAGSDQERPRLIRTLFRVPRERLDERGVLRLLPRHVRTVVHLGLDQARPTLCLGLGVERLHDRRIALAADPCLPLMTAAVSVIPPAQAPR